MGEKQMCAGTIRIRVNKKTGSINFEKEDVDKDRILELLKELVGDITNISCHELDDDADPDGDRQSIIFEDDEENREEEFE